MKLLYLLLFPILYSTVHKNSNEKAHSAFYLVDLLSGDTIPDIVRDDSTYVLVDTAVYRVSRQDSIQFERLKNTNLTWWEKMNRDNLCTGMKAPYQYRNGKIIRNN